MILVYFRGHGDWLIDDENGKPNHIIEIQDRGAYTDGPHFYGYWFYRPCDIVEGVFKLTDSDEKLYKSTGIFNKENISVLIPCIHHDSAFKNQVEKCKFTDDVFEKCYFKIATHRFRPSVIINKHFSTNKLDYELALYKPIADTSNAIRLVLTE